MSVLLMLVQFIFLPAIFASVSSSESARPYSSTWPLASDGASLGSSNQNTESLRHERVVFCLMVFGWILFTSIYEPDAQKKKHLEEAERRLYDMGTYRPRYR